MSCSRNSSFACTSSLTGQWDSVWRASQAASGSGAIVKVNLISSPGWNYGPEKTLPKLYTAQLKQNPANNTKASSYRGQDIHLGAEQRHKATKKSWDSSSRKFSSWLNSVPI